MSLVVPIEGTVEVLKGRYVRIYIRGEESKLLAKYHGKRVKGLIVVMINDSS